MLSHYTVFTGTPISVLKFEKGTKFISIGLTECCEAETVIIPEGVEELDENSFWRSQSLKKIYFPSTLKKVGEWSFNCRPTDREMTISDIYYGVSKEQWNNISFADPDFRSATIHFNCKEDDVFAGVVNVNNFIVKNKSNTSITLAWDKNASAKGYIIEQYKGGKWTQIAKTSSNAAVTYTVNGLAADTTYTFRIKAYVISGESEIYSDYVKIAGKTRIANVASFKGSAASASAVKLDWSKNDKATGYVIEQYKGGKWTAIATTKNNTTLTFTVKGLADDTAYSFRIKSYRTVNGVTDFSEYTSVKAKTLLGNVKTFTAAATGTTAIKLDWSKNDKATGYVIEQYKGGKWTALAATKNNTTLTFTVKGLAEGTAYSFRIKSFRKTGSTTEFSEYTAIKAATLLGGVSDLKVTSVTGSWITLEWAKNDKATGYAIEQYKGGKWTVIATTKNNTTLKFTVKGLKNDTTYSFRIRAYKTSGSVTAYSDYVRIAGKTRIPNVATFTGSAVSASAAKLDWSKNDKATGYVIEQYKGGKWTVLATTKNNTTLTFTVKGLAKGTTYSFRIKSFRKTGSTTEFSEYTAIKAATLK